MIAPGSARNKGRQFERKIAAQLGGKRAPLSGAVGGGDLWIHGGIWADWCYELKKRARLPAFMTSVLDQAEQAAQGTRQKPAGVVAEDHGRAIFFCYLDDMKTWADALAEVGMGHKIRDAAGHAEAILRDIKEWARSSQ